MRDIEQYRAGYLATGAALGPGAGLLRDEGDSAGLQLLLGIGLTLLLGAWPFGSLAAREARKYLRDPERPSAE